MEESKGVRIGDSPNCYCPPQLCVWQLSCRHCHFNCRCGTCHCYHYQYQRRNHNHHYQHQ
ncbi:hypothetical protein E2C01_098243 [Portunus trituberculatus]|uniref:Uncharacterized protein n=1 Tax=Portunus trituberculatus TaxID=210409 RepID=A0A5B7K7W8_PORTR|nr:hypothetical protein [Portunus trituberculatus]